MFDFYSINVNIHIKKIPKKKIRERPRARFGLRSFLNSGTKSEAPMYKKLPAANSST